MQTQTAPPADKLIASVNAGGGWGYAAGKASRIEPTCWALLAQGRGLASSPALATHRDFFVRCAQSNGWLVEDPRWPVNIAFNALAAFTWLEQPALAPEPMRRRLLTALVASKGLRADQVPNLPQDNSLQGWPWIDGTFSWVEPTAWGLLALKRARRAGITDAASDARIAEGEKVLIDRCCRTGGWNFGNASMMQQDLRAYVPTTALALLALQDKRQEPVVARSLPFLEHHWNDEISGMSLGLSYICLARYGRPVGLIERRVREHVARAESFANVPGMAAIALALSARDRAIVV